VRGAFVILGKELSERGGRARSAVAPTAKSSFTPEGREGRLGVTRHRLLYSADRRHRCRLASRKREKLWSPGTAPFEWGH
jgi:hypothetical protein